LESSDKENIFKTIQKDYQNQVHRICWGFTERPEDVKDLYQDVMINIWKGLGGFRNEASYGTWVHRITINTCLLWKRRKKKHLEITEELTKDYNVYYEGFGSEENEELLQLKRAIRKLKKSDKTIILLVLEELSYNEIAEVTGLSISNIGVKINRIKTRLKKHLQKSI